LRASRTFGLAALLALTGAQGTPPADQVVACLATGRPAIRWELPPLFREVSGLALHDDGRLFLHNDERAIVAAVDTATGRVTASYQLGAAPALGDFEGVAIAGPSLFLVTSAGVLYQVPVPRVGQPSGALPVTVTPTGVGQFCEVEGLAHDARDRVLLLACKTPRAKDLGRDVAVYRWSIERRALAVPARVVVPRSDLARSRKAADFHSSSIEVDPRTGRWILITSADRAVAAVERTGQVVAVAPLGGRHPQPEGLAIDRRGRVFVSDEGAKGPGSIAVYACR